MRVGMVLAAAAAIAGVGASAARANVYNVSLTGQVANFLNFQVVSGHTLFDEHYLPLSGLDSSNAITVFQGDEIDATVTLDQALTVPASQVRTDLLLFLMGSAFPSINTGVTGTLTLMDGGSTVAQFGYASTTSSQLSNFAALLPPDNHAYTFDSFTDDFTIYDLSQPATLDGAAFDYTLLSNVPEPSTWIMMLLGLGLIGAALRLRPSAALA